MTVMPKLAEALRDAIDTQDERRIQWQEDQIVTAERIFAEVRDMRDMWRVQRSCPPLSPRARVHLELIRDWCSRMLEQDNEHDVL